MPNSIPPSFKLEVDEDLVLMVPRIEDAAELFALIDKNRTHLRTFLGWLDHNTRIEDSQEFIENGLVDWLSLKSLHLTIVYQAKKVGAVGFNNIDYDNHSAFMGYWLDQSSQGKGIMSRAVKALIEYGFNELKLHRIQVLCATANTPSEKLALSVGFKKEGLLKEAIFNYDKYLDANIYGLINPSSLNRSLEKGGII